MLLTFPTSEWLAFSNCWGTVKHIIISKKTKVVIDTWWICYLWIKRSVSHFQPYTCDKRTYIWVATCKVKLMTLLWLCIYILKKWVVQITKRSTILEIRTFSVIAAMAMFSHLSLWVWFDSQLLNVLGWPTLDENIQTTLGTYDLII